MANLEMKANIATQGVDEAGQEVWQEFSHKGQRWSFNDDELAILDAEDGCFYFDSYHLLSKPCIASVTAFIDAMPTEHGK